MIFIDNNMIRLFQLVLISRPSIECFDILMIMSNKGNITGKLNTAISEGLFDAFEAIPEFMVSTAANPIDPRIIFIRNRLVSCTGLPKTML